MGRMWAVSWLSRSSIDFSDTSALIFGNAIKGFLGVRGGRFFVLLLGTFLREPGVGFE